MSACVSASVAAAEIAHARHHPRTRRATHKLAGHQALASDRLNDLEGGGLFPLVQVPLSLAGAPVAFEISDGGLRSLAARARTTQAVAALAGAEEQLAATRRAVTRGA